MVLQFVLAIKKMHGQVKGIHFINTTQVYPALVIGIVINIHAAVVAEGKRNFKVAPRVSLNLVFAFGQTQILLIDFH